MIKTADELLLLSVQIGGRVVSSNDLNQFQISESQAAGRWYVDQNGFGWAVLPWDLTTDRDRNREREYLTPPLVKQTGGHGWGQ